MLLGITTVCGEPEKRAAVADAICRAAGRAVPIAAGLDSTMQPVPVYPMPDGAGRMPPAFLYQKIKENPHEIVRIGIGNMTDIATLFRTYPDAAGFSADLHAMNGCFGRSLAITGIHGRTLWLLKSCLLPVWRRIGPSRWK